MDKCFYLTYLEGVRIQIVLLGWSRWQKHKMIIIILITKMVKLNLTMLLGFGL